MPAGAREPYANPPIRIGKHIYININIFAINTHTHTLVIACIEEVLCAVRTWFILVVQVSTEMSQVWARESNRLRRRRPGVR